MILLLAADTLGPWAQVRAKYEEVQALRARFVERVHYADGGEGIFRGTLLLKAPNKVRIEVTAPSAQLIVSDGKVAWFKDSSGEVLSQPVEEVSKAVDPRLILLKVPEGFKITYSPHDSLHLYTLLAPEGYPYSKVEVTLSRSLLPVEVKITDRVGNTYDFVLEEVELNPPAPDSLFSLSVEPTPGSRGF